MRKYILLSLILFPLFSMSQQWKKTRKEILFGVGAANLLGDLGGADQIGTHLMKDLEILDLSNNNLSSIPSTIGEMKRLRKIILRNNKLSTLPASLANCTNLEELDITGNPITCGCIYRKPYHRIYH